MKVSCEIQSFGAFIPEKAISNYDIAAMVETSDQWIIERTGIRSRRRLDDVDNTSDLAVRASRLAMAQIDMDPASLTHVVVATCTPDHLAPSVACIVAGAINAGPVMAFDVEAACTGFIYGISVCRSLLAGEPDSRILFVCAEALTRRVNWQDRSTSILFGDGAVAAVICGNAERPVCALEDVLCRSDGNQRDLIIVGGGTSCNYALGSRVTDDFFISMQGRDTYRQAVRQMVSVCKELLERNGLSIADIDLFVPHQANMRIIEAVGSRLEIDPDRVFVNVADYGNTSAASIPLALTEAMAKGRIAAGARVLVTAFGSGLTWGAALLHF